MQTRAHQLLALGQSLWLDHIHRRDLGSGVFEQQMAQGIVGVTSNPTIFQQAIGDSDVYDASIERHLGAGLSGEALFTAVEVEDIQRACDLLAPAFERSAGLDGRVSIECNPHLAHDTAATIAEAKALHRMVARPNVMVKVPATAEGIPAIAALTAEGMCINITLIFSIARYLQVMEAYLGGLEQRMARGLPLQSIRSVASFFVSRVDTKVDKAIEAAAATRREGDPARDELLNGRGRAAVANARLAYAAFQEAFGGPRFAALARQGAHVQRPLWASTSTKNKAYPDTLYLDELIGPDTVNTVPPATFVAFLDHGRVEPAITRDLAGARAWFRRLPELGVPVEELIAELEEEGVVAFDTSWDSLLGTLESKRQALAGRAR